MGRLRIFGHTLQPCIKPVFELSSVAKLISKYRKLVEHFKHSTTVTAEMRKRQTLLNVPEHELVQDVVTRWNSTQLMLSRLVEQRRVLTDILLDEKFTKKMTAFLPNDHVWDLMSDLSTVLSDLSEVATYMCSRKMYHCQKFTLLCVDYDRKNLKVLNSDGNVFRKAK